MDYVKVQFNIPSGRRQTVYRLLAKQCDGFFLSLKTLVVGSEEPNISTEEFLKTYRIYWIDNNADNEQIDVVDQVNIDVFFTNSENNKLFVEPIGEGAPTSTRGSQGAAASEADVHEDISCDGCDKTPIVGFRYKCVQCPDYDLCADCEAKKKHSEHVMFRFPTALQNIPFNRKFLKKMKRRGCFIQPDNEEGTSRRHGHGHGHKNRHNIFSSLYTMMHDMAEGTEGPAQEDFTEQAAGGGSKKEKEDRKNRRGTQKEVPVIPVDPTYLKAGVQVLNNFSEMFAKMLNPAVVPDVNVPGDSRKCSGANAENPGPSGENASTQSQEKPNEVPVETGATAPPTEESQPSVAEEAGAAILTTDAPSTGKPPAEQKEYSESDWTIINPPASTARRDSEASSASKNSNTSSVEQSKDGSPTVDYAKISKDLQEHIRKEEEQNKAAQSEAAAAKQTESQEWRAQIVYHKNHRINNAVHAMMAMGFSNESNWLTQLLESVDGDISQALDLMKPVK